MNDVTRECALRALSALTCALVMAGCAAMPADFDEGDDDIDVAILPVAHDGRWALPADVKAAGEAQSGSYEAAPSWSGGANCSGGFLAGSRELGDYIVRTFSGVSHYEGYACRPNTADTSRTSMHGTGRAIDVFIPVAAGEQADNDLGDPVANWLVANASDIGIQFLIWDRTKWNISYDGVKDRQYGGPHPHHDHIHVELSTAGANRTTPFFTRGPGDSPADDGGGAAPAPGADPGTDPGVTPTDGGGTACTDTCSWANDGSCDDGGPSASYADCDLGTDCSDCGSRAADTGTGGGADPTPPSDPAPSDPPPSGSGSCDNTCYYAGDGECDDGGPGSLYSVCAFGSDCADCGAR